MADNITFQLRALGAQAQVVSGSREDYNGLMELIGESRFVLLGEASHGTHDFYETRARITERLDLGERLHRRSR